MYTVERPTGQQSVCGDQQTETELLPWLNANNWEVVLLMGERRYHEEHTWVRLEKDEVLVGVTDYAQNEMGDIIYAELPEEGAGIVEGESFATIESAKAVQDLVAPLSGEVLRCNDGLLDAPEVINEDPYGNGWLVAVKPDEAFDPGSLLSEEEYQQSTAAEPDNEDVV